VFTGAGCFFACFSSLLKFRFLILFTSIPLSEALMLDPSGLLGFGGWLVGSQRRLRKTWGMVDSAALPTVRSIGGRVWCFVGPFLS